MEYTVGIGPFLVGGAVVATIVYLALKGELGKW
jgi:hypothetical protein